MPQGKGLVSFVYALEPITNQAETSVTYDLPELGDSIAAADAVVHIRKNPKALISGITINVVKGTKGLNAVLLKVKLGIPATLTINDDGNGVRGVMFSANPTQITISDSTNTSDVETVSFTFKGNFQILSLEG